MELKILHFYPDLMSLYGSYANVSILKRTLEELGNTVTVERVELGGDADLTHADFVYMGAGTERAQKAALLNFSKLGDAVKAAAYLLTYSGRFCMCHRPERLVDALDMMRKYKLEPKRLKFVVDKTGEEPFFFVVEGKKGAKPFLRVEPTLVIKNEESRFTKEMLEIYGSYADGYEDKVR